MKVLVGADHGGYDLKEGLKPWLVSRGYACEDVGGFTPEMQDYPDVVQEFTKTFHPQEMMGILICGSGHGVCIGANRFPQNRAILGRSVQDVIIGRQHNHANILCIGARMTEESLAFEMVFAFLSTPVDSSERHQRRVHKLCNMKYSR